MPFITPTAQLRQPDTLDAPGLLVGWSLERQRKRPPIGFNHGNPLQVPQTGYVDPVLLHGEGHLMTIAPTGAGKGTGCIVPALLRYPGPVIVIDPKGENVAITARRRREMGHRVIVLDPMGITDQESDHFNPLDVVDISQSVAVDEVAAFARALSTGADGDQERNRFWTNRGTHLLIGAMLASLQAKHDAAVSGLDAKTAARLGNLGSVRHMISLGATEPKELAELFDDSRHPEVRRIASLLQIGASETLGGIVAFAQESVDFLRGDNLLRHISDTSFDIDDVTSGAPLSIYLVLPPHMLESHGRLLRLWLTAFITCITRRRAKPNMSTLLLLDEAAQLGELAQLRQAVTLLRGYGVQTWSFWQDVSQIQTLYPRDWKTMVNNCKVLQCFGALNQGAADDMANLTGFGDGLAVLDLEADEMLLQVAGDQAVVARLPDYRSDPAFTGKFDPNPYHDPLRDIMPPRDAPQRLYVRPQASQPEHVNVLPVYATLAADDPLLPGLLRKWRPDGEGSADSAGNPQS